MKNEIDIDKVLFELEEDNELYSTVFEEEELNIYNEIWKVVDIKNDITDVEEQVYEEIDKTYTLTNPNYDFIIEICISVVHRYCVGTELCDSYNSYSIIKDIEKCDHTFYEVWFVNEDKTPFEFIESKCTKCGYIDNTI
jgi:hypothetical protein